MPSTTLPPWLRALNRVAAASHRLARLAAAVRDESALAWTAPADRANLTASLFDRARTYAPGGAMFALGLFDWERDLLAPPFPQRGRILIGGAGGGREAVALLERGYDVIAFDPARELVRRGAPVVAAAGGTLIAASYADVIRQAAGDSTPLTPVLGMPVDGVLLGWDSFSLVVSDGERVALLRAVRAIAPTAPVALSFGEHSEADPPDSGVARARAALRRLYGRRGAPGYSGERMRYAPWAGILRESSVPEVETVARAAGYEVAKHGSAPGRMLLMPVAGATDAA